MPRSATTLLLAALLALSPCTRALAAALGLGSKLSKVTLTDQYGKKHVIDERVRVIVLTRDMDAGDVVKTALGHNGDAVLSRHKAVYVSDVSSMPSLIRRYLALPKLKERTYPMLLDETGEFSTALPSRNKHATLIFLDGMRVVAVEYVMRPEAFVPTLESPKRFATR